MTAKSDHHAAAFLLGLIPTGTSPRDFFTTYKLDSANDSSLRLAAQDDARGYVYNATISFLSGLAGLHNQEGAWAVTKMYYSVFYSARAALCRSNLVIFHVPKSGGDGHTQYQIRVQPGNRAEVVEKPPSTHKLVAKRFRETAYPFFMRGLQIDGVDPVLWLMQLREYWQYRAARFLDPELPDVFEAIDTRKAPRLLGEYARDTEGVFLADRTHAALAVPFRLLLWALSEDELLSPGVVDREDVAYLRKLCRVGGLKLTALDQHLPNQRAG